MASGQVTPLAGGTRPTAEHNPDTHVATIIGRDPIIVFAPCTCRTPGCGFTSTIYPREWNAWG